MNDLRDAITAGLDAVAPPEGNLSAVKRVGSAARRRRQTGIGAGAGLAAAALGLTVAQLTGGAAPDPKPQAPQYLTLASFDVSNGLRAFADPDENGRINLGDKSFPKEDMRYLDTDAMATPYGMLFFDSDQKPRLLGQNGHVVELFDGPPAPVEGARSAPKADSVEPFVAWTENHGDFIRIVVYDLSARSAVRTRDVPCAAKSCAKVTVEAIDEGVAYVRTAKGSFTWSADDAWTLLGGTAMRVVDVRGSTMLWEGEAPTEQAEGWTYLKAPIDSELTFDGKNILYWSNVLKSVEKDGRTITLAAGGNGLEGGSWYALDTDGSVLVATRSQQINGSKHANAEVFDCELPAGTCEKLGTVSTNSGDPQFIGSDSF